ncbi:MAG: hypothetical protein IH891_05280 [Planctomycetes bacterium]|nr:hypothetical protein [Planctomycetota bacterium]
MLRIIVCLLGAILLLATLTGVSTMVQENREAVSMEKTAQTIDIMRRVLARSISREINELYASEDEGQEDGKEIKTVNVGGGTSGVRGNYAPRSSGDGWATSTDASLVYALAVSRYSTLNFHTSNTRGFRIPGQGVIFTLDVSVPARQVEIEAVDKKEQADADDDWEQARNEASGRSANAYALYTRNLVVSGEKPKQYETVIEPEAVDAVIKAVIKSVSRYGLKIQGLDDDDSIVVAMQLEGNRIIQSSGVVNRLILTGRSSGSARLRVIIEIDGSVLRRYADGKIDLDAVRSRAKITSYTDGKSSLTTSIIQPRTFSPR